MRVCGVSMAGVLAALALSCACGPAEAASGLEPGVHVSPGSPAAKEYALPLNQARQTGTGAGGGAHRETLFGAGITPPVSGGSARAGTHAGAGRSAHARGAGAAIPTLTTRPAPLPSAVLRAARTSSGDNGSVLALVGGGVAILVLGAFGGIVLRHSRRPNPSA